MYPFEKETRDYLIYKSLPSWNREGTLSLHESKREHPNTTCINQSAQDWTNERNGGAKTCTLMDRQKMVGRRQGTCKQLTGTGQARVMQVQQLRSCMLPMIGQPCLWSPKPAHTHVHACYGNLLCVTPKHNDRGESAVIAHPRLLVWVTSERWVRAVVATSGSQWLNQL